MATTKYVRIYLNDHLAGSTVGLELVKRIASQYEDSELGTFAGGLVAEIDADREELKRIMEELDAPKDVPKVAVAWIAEKAGRLKLNGELFDRSPLSPVVELEALSLGIEGKRSLWIALKETLGDVIGVERLDRLIARAEEQRAGVERHRREAVRIAFLEPTE
jgi:hypothetical protein